MLYRTDELGTKGEELHFDHWADVVDSGYTWYRQNKIGGTTNANINSAMLYPFTDPDSPAGGISIDGWKALWKFCADGKSGGDDYKYGFDPLNKGDVAISSTPPPCTARLTLPQTVRSILWSVPPRPRTGMLLTSRTAPITSPSTSAFSTRPGAARKRPQP